MAGGLIYLPLKWVVEGMHVAGHFKHVLTHLGLSHFLAKQTMRVCSEISLCCSYVIYLKIKVNFHGLNSHFSNPILDLFLYSHIFIYIFFLSLLLYFLSPVHVDNSTLCLVMHSVQVHESKQVHCNDGTGYLLMTT